MPALDRNSIGLNAVCCCLFIDKTFQRTSLRVAQLCAPSGKRYSHQAIRILGSLRQKYCDVCRNRAVLGRWVRSAIQDYASTKDPSLQRRASVDVALILYVGQKREAAERRSVFCRALQELSAEGGGEVRRASESAAQSNIKSAFISIAKHRFRSLHS